jgi:small subunit ribosomal protein S8
MTMTDPIADMLTRIRNALKASHESVDIPNSKMKANIAKILKSEGYVRNFKIISDSRQGVLRVFLKYDEQKLPVISGIERVSKPSRRVYAGFDEIPGVLNQYGVNILTTSRGIMSDRDARRMRVGGEILCRIW